LATFYRTPTFSFLNYTKEVQHVSRLDTKKLREILQTELGDNRNFILGLERPMLDNTKWKASLSAIRCYEATLIVLEDMMIPYDVVDSRKWQKEMLPAGIEGRPALKQASKEVATRLFPHLAKQFKEEGDSILLAEYLRRQDQKSL
jgi:hypothetical protein